MLTRRCRDAEKIAAISRTTDISPQGRGHGTRQELVLRHRSTDGLASAFGVQPGAKAPLSRTHQNTSVGPLAQAGEVEEIIASPPAGSTRADAALYPPPLSGVTSGGRSNRDR